MAPKVPTEPRRLLPAAPRPAGSSQFGRPPAYGVHLAARKSTHRAGRGPQRLNSAAGTFAGDPAMFSKHEWPRCVLGWAVSGCSRQVERRIPTTRLYCVNGSLKRADVDLRRSAAHPDDQLGEEPKIVVGIGDDGLERGLGNGCDRAGHVYMATRSTRTSLTSSPILVSAEVGARRVRRSGPLTT
jgi:hypothetical protein